MTKPLMTSKVAVAAAALIVFSTVWSIAAWAQRPAADIKPPLGLVPIPWPDDNAYSAAKAELGKLLYFDARLSADNSVACASCHASDNDA
jgi:cytochrome c peroxidase